MLNIVTMAVDIGRIHPFTLRKTFELFYNSIARHNKNFTISIYTNLPKRWFTRDKVNVYDIAQQDFLELYVGNSWFNLTFHRLFLLEKHLVMGENPVWIDLDTIICDNIEYFTNYPNLFVKYGFGENMVTIDSSHARPQKEWIHGHFFKIDLKIVLWVKEILEKNENIPHYELMSFFTLLEIRHPDHFHILNRITNKIVNFEWCHDAGRPMGKINSLTADYFHPAPHLIKDRVKLVHGRLQGYDGRDFAMMTFTFFTLEANLRRNWSTINDDGAMKWLRNLCRITFWDRLRFYVIHCYHYVRRDNIKRIPVVRQIIRSLRT